MLLKSRKLALRSGVSMMVVCALSVAAPVIAQEAAPATETSASATDDAVVITTRRRALQTATERKKNSDTMIDSVVADEAGKLPDASITEVLQRVSGVTIVRFASLGNPDLFSAEGSGIQVRGLSGVSSTLNGREIFSAQGGGGLSWGDVTPELMAAVDVYKANRADLIEGGTGGTVDLRTKMPFDYKKPALNGSLNYSYGDYIKEGTGGGSFLVTDRFDTPIGEIGLLFDVAYSDYKSGNSFIRSEPYWKRNIGGQDRYVPGGFNYGDNQFHRTRTGIYAAAQWRPSDTLTISQTIFSSRYESDNTESGVFVGDRDKLIPLGNAEWDSNGALIRSNKIGMGSTAQGDAGETIGDDWRPVANQVDCNTPYGTQAQSLQWTTSPAINNGEPYCQIQKVGIGSTRGFALSDNATSDFSTSFVWTPTDSARIRGAVQFVDAYARSEMFGSGLNAQISSYSMDLGDGEELPLFAVADKAELANKLLYGWDNVRRRYTNNHATMGAVNLDGDFDLGEGFFKTLSVGARYANRLERDNYAGTYWAAVGRGWNGSPQRTVADGNPEDAEIYTFDNFFKGELEVPASFYLPSGDLVRSADELYLMNTYGFNNQCNADPVDPNGNRLTPDNKGCLYGSVPATSLLTFDPFAFSRTNVLNKAIYVQTKFGSDEGLFGIPFTGNLGIRIVRNEVTSEGSFAFNNGIDTTAGYTDVYLTQADASADLAEGPTARGRTVRFTLDGFDRSVVNKYTKYLPSINLNFKPSDELFVRFAANVTMSQPGFGDIRASGNGGINTIANTNNTPGTPTTPGVNYPPILTGFSANTGNPNLKPTMSNNFDASVEWYPSSNLNGHFGVFYKKLDDLIVYGDTTKDVSFTMTRKNGQEVVVTRQQTSSEVFNSPEEATIKGFEMGGRKFFDELPAPFNGLGIEANYTYIDSDNPGALAYDISGNKLLDNPIVGLSKHNYNIQLMYEKNDLSVRVAYSWRDKYLQSTNSGGTNGTYRYYQQTGPNSATRSELMVSLPVYAAATGQLDLGVYYNINSHVKVNLQATNLLNEATRTLMGGYPNGALYTRSWFITDSRINVGLDFSF